MKIFESYSEADTIAIAKEFAKGLNPGDIVAFDGELGAGKTAFTKGVALGLGVDDDVTSPTFTIVNQYDGDLTLYHFDVYRLENVDPDNCDWMDDYFFSDGVCLIEWAEHIQDVLPSGFKTIKITKDIQKGEDYRQIVID